jgi:hypothetical protein
MPRDGGSGGAVPKIRFSGTARTTIMFAGLVPVLLLALLRVTDLPLLAG